MPTDPKPRAPLSIAPVRDQEEIFDLLAPHVPWTASRLPDPRTAPIARIADGLVAIARAEGPVLDHRAFHMYTAAAGLARAVRDVVARYRAAVKKARERGLLECDPDGAEPTPLVLRTPGQPLVALRERGDRTLEEIPISELAALMRKLELERGEAWASGEERFRRVLEVYKLVRLTPKARERLEAACARAALPRWSKALSATFEPEGPPPKLARPRRTHRRLRHG